jgi:hypothetical protein
LASIKRVRIAIDNARHTARQQGGLVDLLRIELAYLVKDIAEDGGRLRGRNGWVRVGGTAFGVEGLQPFLCHPIVKRVARPVLCAKRLEQGRVGLVLDLRPSLADLALRRLSWGGRCLVGKIKARPQRRMLPRNLLVVAQSHHLIADGNQHCAQILARGREFFDKRTREGRIPARAIGCDVSGLRRKADQRADARLGRRQPAPDLGRSRAHRAREVAHERIVTARIEKQDAGLGLPFHHPLHEIEPRRFKIQPGGVLELGVNWNKEVLSADLQAMTGIEEYGCICPFQGLGELPHLSFQPLFVKLTALDDLEAELSQRGGNVRCVVRRVSELACMPIIGIADDKRDPLLRPGSNGDTR